jgi:hypothetical protein
VSARRLAALLPLVTALLLGSGLVAPAQAAAPLAVSSVTVGTQVQGSNWTWVIPVSWEASLDATGYAVSITNAAGTRTYKTKDVGAVTQTTLTSADLTDGQAYKVSVVAFSGPDESAATTADLTAISLDRGAPTGTFTVAPSHAWLIYDFMSFDESQTASVTIKQVTVSDDTSTTITRKVLAGDGTAARTWASGSALTITYTKAGTFTPKVQLTDEFGNTGTVSLSPVTIYEDNIAPVVRITRPSSSMRDRISGWRKIRGTAVDGQTGVDTALVMLVQKRGAYWYVYNFHKRVWVKGRTGQIDTLAHTKARPAVLSPDSLGQWHTGRIRGLKQGKMVVRSAAFDGSFNLGTAVVRQQITQP